MGVRGLKLRAVSRLPYAGITRIRFSGVLSGPGHAGTTPNDKPYVTPRKQALATEASVVPPTSQGRGRLPPVFSARLAVATLGRS